jgi:hypothetical protein
MLGRLREKRLGGRMSHEKAVAFVNFGASERILG